MRRNVPEDIYTLCTKGEFVDEMSNVDKRDIAHSAAVLSGALAIIEELELAERESGGER